MRIVNMNDNLNVGLLLRAERRLQFIEECIDFQYGLVKSLNWRYLREDLESITPEMLYKEKEKCVNLLAMIDNTYEIMFRNNIIETGDWFDRFIYFMNDVFLYFSIFGHDRRAQYIK